MTTIGRVPEFDPSKEDFESLLERFERWLDANKIADGQKANVFLSVLGLTEFRLLKSLVEPRKCVELTYTELTEALSSNFKPILMAERFRFYRCVQNTGEPLADFLINLKKLASSCEFGQFLAEIGASVTIVPEKVYREGLEQCSLEPAAVRLSSYTGDQIPVLGKTQVPVKYDRNEWMLPLLVVKSEKTALLGCNWLKEIKLNWTEIFRVKGDKPLSAPTLRPFLKKSAPTLRPIRDCSGKAMERCRGSRQRSEFKMEPSLGSTSHAQCPTL